MRTIAFLLLFATSAAAQLETTPPPPGPPRPFVIPAVVERTLPNGLRVIVAERKESPFCSVELVIHVGSADDPPELAGLAWVTTSMLGKDTDLPAELEALGASLDRTTTQDASFLTVSLLRSEDLRFALARVAAAMESRTFERGDAEDEARLDTFLALSQDDLRLDMKEAERVAILAAPHVVFRNAYAHNISGSAASLDRIEPAQVAAFKRTYMRPGNAVLIVGGDVPAQRVFSMVARAFGRWRPAGNEPLQQKEIAESAPSRRIVVIDMPDAPNASVIVGRPALRRNDAAYAAADVTDAVFGDGSASRLYREIRVDRGLSYDPYASVSPRRGAGPFYALVEAKNDDAAEVAGLIVDEMEKLVSAPPDAAELQARKAAVAGRFHRSMETIAGVVDHLAELTAYWISPNELRRYPDEIGRVTSDDVQRYAARSLRAADASIIIAGDAEQFVPALRERFGQDLTIIPIDELDLDSCCDAAAARDTTSDCDRAGTVRAAARHK